MAPGKRPAETDQHDACLPSRHYSKKRRIDASATDSLGPRLGLGLDLSCCPNIDSRDFLSRLSDELVLRILSFLPVSHLLAASSASRRLYRLSSDSQLWRHLYYLRFVLPRALRIPGFQPSRSQESGVCTRTVLRHSGVEFRKSRARGEPVDWKRQYKLRHNWARGKCAVEELDVGRQGRVESCREMETLVKVVEGTAVTADLDSGLRVWDLKTKTLLAEASFAEAGTPAAPAAPTCLAVDDQQLVDGQLEVSVGFVDGTFTVWSYAVDGGSLVHHYSHTPQNRRSLVQVAYSFPYLMTASDDAVVSLYSFRQGGARLQKTPFREGEAEAEVEAKVAELVTSLKSHSSEAPLALSIRGLTGPASASGTAIASIAFTLATRDGWTIGIQDFHVKCIESGGETTKPEPEIFSTRLAHAATPLTNSQTRVRPRSLHADDMHSANAQDASPGRLGRPGLGRHQGPKALCYTHPYLLATLPDNTLILYLCTSDANALSISPGIRLWGHTSGIADAEITSRGKAVSVSCRGDEVRVWELEGRSGGTSVAVRPSQDKMDETEGEGLADGLADELAPGERRAVPAVPDEWADRRNWVGFDDEMVIVLKESRCGKESLVVYDFT